MYYSQHLASRYKDIRYKGIKPHTQGMEYCKDEGCEWRCPLPVSGSTARGPYHGMTLPWRRQHTHGDDVVSVEPALHGTVRNIRINQHVVDMSKDVTAREINKRKKIGEANANSSPVASVFFFLL
jgi:hypothetical protein